MSVEQANTIDLMTINRESGDVILTISDHVDWLNSNAHHQMLQRKLHTHLAFVEGGQVIKEQPKAEGRSIVFCNCLQVSARSDGKSIPRRGKWVIKTAGSLKYDLFAES
jgi:hypothetical protein